MRRFFVLSVVLCAGTFARANDLASTIEAGIQKIGKGAKVSVVVKSVTTGETLYTRDAHEPLVPASTMKLATTAAALELLGPNFEHETRVLVRGTLANGVLKGDLVIVGSGDPTLSRRFQIDERPLLEDWAEELAKSVKVIEGDVIADDRAFEKLSFHPDWNPKDANDWFAAPVSALNFNDNCLDVEVSVEKGTPRVVARPETMTLPLTIDLRVVGTRKEHALAVVRHGEGYRVSGKAWGKMPPHEVSVPLADPALSFARILAERLQAAGVTVRGKARVASAEEPAAQGAPLLVRKAPIARTLAVCNKRSQNLYAETLLKTLGHEKGTSGSWTGGAAVVEKFLGGLGVPSTEFRVRDGSGLSREDRLSATALSRVLEATASGANSSTFIGSLSVAGEDGTLEKRLSDLPGGAKFLGKTGTMHGISALAGLLSLPRNASGESELIAIVFVVNGTQGAATARKAQDECVRATVQVRGASFSNTPSTSKRRKGE